MARLTEGIPPSYIPPKNQPSWLIGGLGIAIFVLVILLIRVIGQLLTETASNPRSSAATQVSQKELTIPQPVSPVNILVAARDIQASTILEPSMITGKPMTPNEVPREAIWASEKSLIIGKATRKLLRTNMPITLNALSDPSQNIPAPAVINEMNDHSGAQNASAALQKINPKNIPFPIPKPEPKHSPSQGSVRMRNLKTGEYVEWELHNGRWEPK